MPPRSANRRASAKKSTPKSKQPDVESSILSDVNSTVSDFESAAAKANEVEEAAQALIDETETKQVIEGMNGNSVAIEGATCGDEDKVVANTVVEVKIEEEVVEERSTDVVMEDHVNSSTEEVVEGRGIADEDVVEGRCIVEEERVEMECVENEGEPEKNDGAEKGVNAVEENEGVEGEQNEGGVVANDGFQSGIVPVAEMNLAEEETAADQNNDTEALGDNSKLLVANEGSNRKGEAEESGDDEDSEEDSEDNKDDEDPSEFIHDTLTDSKKQKDFEMFIGRLDKGAVEDDLIEVFGKFGDIKAARIVRNSSTKKSKGFAFIRYATVEQAKNALSQLKDGIKVRGKLVKVSASQDNDTLYVGNICKTWTKERVLETLNNYGIEHIEEMHLPDDPKKEGRIKGFARLEFSTHSDAMAAFQRLRMPDAVFGRDRSAKVAFTQTPMHPNEEVLSQVKKVYIEGLTDAWNEEKVKEICEQYGEIVKVTLSRSLGTKRKDFGFITFTSRESALACVEGVNNAQIGDGEVKVKANIAKPQSKGQLQKQGFRGGFKVQKESKVSLSKKESERAKQAGSSKMKGRARSKRAKGKGKTVAEEKGKALSESKTVNGGRSNKPQNGPEVQSVGTTSKLERTNRKRKNLPSKGEGKFGGIEHGDSKRPSKKPRGNMRGRQDSKSSKSKRERHSRKGPDYGADSATYRNPYALGYAASTAYYQGHAHSAISASKTQLTDMAPHAGYLEPVAAKQGLPYSGYVEPVVGTRVQPHAVYRQPAPRTQGQHYVGYLESAVGTQGRPHAGYVQPIVLTQGQSHGGYLQPVVGTQGRPHAGYLQPTVGKRGHDTYDLQLRRAGGHDGQGSSGSSYGGGSALPPSHVTNYTSYAGYEQGGASVGGYYQSSGAYLPRRAYY